MEVFLDLRIFLVCCKCRVEFDKDEINNGGSICVVSFKVQEFNFFVIFF